MLRAFLRGRHVASPQPLAATFRRLHLSSCHFSSALENVKTKDRSLDPKPIPAKMTMKPYVKNLFCGAVDPDVFAFVELDQRSLDILEEMKVEVEKFLSAENISALSKNTISAETITKLKELGIFKLNIPQQYGGMELTCLETIRICEMFSKDLSLFHTLTEYYQHICPLFSQYASDDQKEKYLPALASGELQVGFALWEENSGADVSKLECKAVFQGDKYVLSGTKRWVLNGGTADKFIVFATEGETSHQNGANTINCFLIDKHSPGVSARSMETLGVNGYNDWELTLDNVIVSRENLIGDQGQGLFMLKNLLHGKFTLAGACTGLLRDLLNTTVNHAINKTTFGKPLIENEIIQRDLAQAAARIYALESIAYMTADFYDNVEDPDIEAEVAIVKLYSCETLLFVVQKCLSILGSDSYLKNKPYEKILRDVLFSQFVGTSCDILRMTVALIGLRHLGENIQDIITVRRNPLLYPQKGFRHMVQKLFFDEEQVNFKGIVYHHTHPCFETSADLLERSILKFGVASEEALERWGAKLETKQLNLVRFADIAIDLYVCTAVLARASRSLSIGLRNCDTEGFTANSIVLDCHRRVEEFMAELERSPYNNNDKNYEAIVKSIVDEGKYSAAHPLTRNF